jgi:hypothetical protein
MNRRLRIKGGTYARTCACACACTYRPGWSPQVDPMCTCTCTLRLVDSPRASHSAPGRTVPAKGSRASGRSRDDETRCSQTALQLARPTLPGESRSSNPAQSSSPTRAPATYPGNTRAARHLRRPFPRINTTPHRQWCLRRCAGATLRRD